MKPTEPGWYEALRGNPHQVSMFNNELQAKIKFQARSLPTQKKTYMYRVALLSIGLFTMVGIILFAASHVNLPDKYTTTGQSSIIDSQHLDYMDKVDSSTYSEVLFKKNIADDKMLVFNKKWYEINKLLRHVYEAQIFEWKSVGWNPATEQSNPAQWHLTYSFALGDLKSERDEEKIKVGWFELGFVGVVIDPQITQIQAVDEQNNYHPASILETLDGYDFWYIDLLDKSALYRLEGLDEEENVIFEELYFKQN